MGLLTSVKENRFVNKLNWSVLSCHDKALAIAAESLIPNASLYFLLFKFAGRNNLLSDRNMGIGNDSYYKYIENESGLVFERCYINGSLLFDELKHLADIKATVVFLVNTKYQKGARLEGKKDHPHFMVYKGYSEQGYHFIDEDWSKEYWRIKSTDTDVCYVERVIGFDELEALACGISSCNVFPVDQSKKEKAGSPHFIYYKLVNSACKPCHLDSIQERFIETLSQYLETREEHYAYIISEMEKFKQKLGERRAETIKEVNSRLSVDEQEKDTEAMRAQEAAARKDQIFAIRSRFIYPYESELIGAHADFLQTISRLVELRTNSFPEKEGWLIGAKGLLEQYEMIKLQISRGVILVDASIVDRAMELFENVYKKECAHYRSLLASEWRLEEYQE